MTEEEYWKKYPWYEIVEGDTLSQGDFIDGCKVVIPTYDLINSDEENTPPGTSSYQVGAYVDTFDVIIVSQSCDLDNVKVDYVLACPRWLYSQAVKDDPKFGTTEAIKRIIRGQEYRYCMLGPGDLPDQPQEAQLVDFNKVFSVPYEVMRKIAFSKGKRLRLRSPYLERLSQAFAYFHMRVALPSDLPDHAKVKAAWQTNIKLAH